MCLIGFLVFSERAIGCLDGDTALVINEGAEWTGPSEILSERSKHQHNISLNCWAIAFAFKWWLYIKKFSQNYGLVVRHICWRIKLWCTCGRTKFKSGSRLQFCVLHPLPCLLRFYQVGHVPNPDACIQHHCVNQEEYIEYWSRTNQSCWSRNTSHLTKHEVPLHDFLLDLYPFWPFCTSSNVFSVDQKSLD